MVLPFVLAGIGITTLITGAVAYWDDILIKFKGKKIAVLGARGVGKSHLINFLTTGSLLEESAQTISSEPFPGKKLNLEGLGLVFIKSGTDVPGGDNTGGGYGEWKKVFLEADIVIYLLRADQLLSGDVNVQERIKRDADHLHGFIEERLKEKREPANLYIVGSHCDLNQDYKNCNKGLAGEFTDKFKELPVIRYITNRAGGEQKAAVILGSMETQSSTRKLTSDIFKHHFI
jgi:GTPase SAR1 family protein